jgi:hypothetical protein
MKKLLTAFTSTLLILVSTSSAYAGMNTYCSKQIAEDVEIRYFGDRFEGWAFITNGDDMEMGIEVIGTLEDIKVVKRNESIEDNCYHLEESFTALLTSKMPNAKAETSRVECFTEVISKACYMD